MINRLLAQKLASVARKFPVVVVTGPRQSGKTTLVRSAFPQKPYVSLEDLDTREFASTDPRGFLGQYTTGAVLDEIQRVPTLFSYLQGIVDEKRKTGLFILTGSQQFLLGQNLSQTLAGRASWLKLLPLSLSEIQTISPALSMNEIIFRGMYPRIYDKRIHPRDWYPSYIQTYIERDVRLIKNIGNLSAFQRFVKHCAARTGQILNLSSLANDCGVTHNTAKSWISILEASFIIHLLTPHYRNFNKRLVKNPKLYFYDTGLVCSLIGIENSKQIESHPLRGSLFETFVISEFIKHRTNLGLPPHLYFWRDKTGHEIDCIYERGNNLIAFEVKSSKTVAEDFFKNMLYWKNISHQTQGRSYLIYAGHPNQKRREAEVIGWRSLPSLRPVFSNDTEKR